MEDDVSGILVRSVATGWVKNAILAVDAGVHLGAIVRIFNEHLPKAVRHQPLPSAPGHPQRPSLHSIRSYHTPASSIPGYFSPASESPRTSGRLDSPTLGGHEPSKPKLCLTTGPFRDLVLPFETAKANALHLVRHFVSTYLITHPHLDHVGAFVTNTAAFQHTTRPKKLAGLPHTIDAVKAYYFNNAVWPNLTDEEGGVGLVSYQRLVDGGNLALGEGGGRGYIDVCDGLAVRGFAVSHGSCIGHAPGKRMSSSSSRHDTTSAERRGSHFSVPPASPDFHRRRSLPHPEAGPPLAGPGSNFDASVVDSSAFFIRDEPTGAEILVFGDVEPDRVSRRPRTSRVWHEAAPKVASGGLRAVFIECSYDDSQSDDTLFGHLAPRHLVAELALLADMVVAVREKADSSRATPSHAPAPVPLTPVADAASRKRKREINGTSHSSSGGGEETERFGRPLRRPSPLHRHTDCSSISPTTRDLSPITQHARHHSPDGMPRPAAKPGAPDLRLRLPISSASAVPGGGSMMSTARPGNDVDNDDEKENRRGSVCQTPLRGLQVIIYHVKDTLADGPPVNEVILQQVREHAAPMGLGCSFLLVRHGESLWL